MKVTRHPSERKRVVATSAIGLVVASVLAFVAPWQFAVIMGWNATAITLLVWIWSSVARLNGEGTRAVAIREDDSRTAARVLLLIASTMSLVVVILAFIEAEQREGAFRVMLNASGVTGVILSWAVVHTVYTLRYAHLYYAYPDNRGGIDFPLEPGHSGEFMPDYHDFAYVAFTVGMTFQVSDTDITTNSMRQAILGHTLLSWLFGAIIVATTINLIANLLR